MRNFKNNRRRFRNNNFEKGLKLTSNDQSVNSALGNVADFKNFSEVIQFSKTNTKIF